jgi:hypothetical protein
MEKSNTQFGPLNLKNCNHLDRTIIKQEKNNIKLTERISLETIMISKGQ